jgi:hypothetical protein
MSVAPRKKGHEGDCAGDFLGSVGDGIVGGLVDELVRLAIMPSVRWCR